MAANNAYMMSAENGMQTLSIYPMYGISGYLDPRKVLKTNISKPNINQYLENFPKAEAQSENKMKKFIQLVFNVHRYVLLRSAANNISEPKRKILRSLSAHIFELVVFLIQKKNNNANRAFINAKLSNIFGRGSNNQTTGIKIKTFMKALYLIKQPERANKNKLDNDGYINRETVNNKGNNNNQAKKLTRYNLIINMLMKIVELIHGHPLGLPPPGNNVPPPFVPPGLGDNDIVDIPRNPKNSNLTRLNMILEQIINVGSKLISLQPNQGGEGPGGGGGPRSGMVPGGRARN